MAIGKIAGSAVLCMLLAGIACAQTPPPGPATTDQPPILMTDTAEYCHHLSGLFTDAQSNAANHTARERDQATLLATEGRRMCDEGQYRPGVQRLRRAIVILAPPE